MFASDLHWHTQYEGGFSLKLDILKLEKLYAKSREIGRMVYYYNTSDLEGQMNQIINIALDITEIISMRTLSHALDKLHAMGRSHVAELNLLIFVKDRLRSEINKQKVDLTMAAHYYVERCVDIIKTRNLDPIFELSKFLLFVSRCMRRLEFNLGEASSLFWFGIKPRGHEDFRSLEYTHEGIVDRRNQRKRGS